MEFILDGYSTRDLYYRWWVIPKKDPIGMDNVRLPQFTVMRVSCSYKLETLSTGNYSRLVGEFIFQRNLGFYLIQIYLPSQLIVVISWVSFWLSRDATPARVALGITTVLTMTTLMTTTNAALPKVSYIKSIDIYLITCYSMVFAALLEYAAVCYLGKIMKRRRDKRAQQAQQQAQHVQQHVTPTPVMMVAHHRTAPYEGASDATMRGTPRISIASPAAASTTGLLPDASRFATLPQDTDDSPKICTCEWDKQRQSLTKLKSLPKKTKPPKRRSQKIIAVTPSAVDKYSRVLFPLLFSTFNALYWGIYVHVSKLHIEKSEEGLKCTKDV